MKRILFGIGRAFGAAGRATIALVGVCGVVAALANYTMTQGAGTNFGSIVVSTVHYAQMLLCDPTTPSQCAAVSAAGAAKVDGSAVTQPVSGTVTANAGTNLNTSALSTSANQVSPNTASVINPTSTLTLTSATTPYTQGQFIANNATGTSVTIPSFAVSNSAGAASIPRLRLSINDSLSTAWPLASIQIDLWSTAPTFASGNGDRSTFNPATGTAAHLGAYTCLMSAEYGDGVYGECYPQVGTASLVKLASGTSVFWTAQVSGGNGSGTVTANKTMSLTAELQN